MSTFHQCTRLHKGEGPGFGDTLGSMIRRNSQKSTSRNAPPGREGLPGFSIPRLAANLLPLCLSALALQACDHATSPTPTPAKGVLELRLVLPDGAPAAGASIEVRPRNSLATEATVSTRATAEGTARLELPWGDWLLLARSKGFALQTTVPDSGRLMDTLRPMSSLEGDFPSEAGAVIRLPGLGLNATCDSQGHFRFDSLPPGEVRLSATYSQRTTSATLTIAPGHHLFLNPLQDELPPHASAVALDTLFGVHAPGIHLASRQLGDSGDFALVASLRRRSSADTITALRWLLPDSTRGDTGIILDWWHLDTAVLTVGHYAQYRAVRSALIGATLDSNAHQLGLSLRDTILSIWLDGSRLYEFYYPHLIDRRRWPDLELGSAGIREVEWIAVRRGPHSDSLFLTP